MTFRLTKQLLRSYCEVTLKPLPAADLLDDFEQDEADGMWRSPKAVQGTDSDNELLNVVAPDCEDFLTALLDAGQKMKDPHYFKTHYAGSQDTKYRERLYCYELYHQLRGVMGEDHAYHLDGEMDKKGQPDFQGSEVIPDFIVHVPGTHRGNMVVVEVKKVDVDICRFKDDLIKLIDFVTRKKRSYHRGIALLYGDGNTDMRLRLLETFDSCVQEHADKVMLVWHRGPTTRPKILRPKS